MTPAWRRLMGLIRLGKWVGLAACILLAAAIPLSNVVHYCRAWHYQTAFLAHGIVTLKDGTPARPGLIAAGACCPDQWVERMGFLLPEWLQIPGNDPAPGVKPPTSCGSGALMPPVQRAYPIWIALLAVAWPTAFLWLADLRNKRRASAGRIQRWTLRAGLVTLGMLVILMAATRFARISISRDYNWSIAFEQGISWFTIVKSGYTANYPMVPISGDEFAPLSAQLGGYRLGARWGTPGLHLRFPIINRRFIYWSLELPLWLPTLLVAAPTLCLFIRSRRPPPGLCDRCGYNLTGNVSGVCPECGTTVNGAVREAAT